MGRGCFVVVTDVYNAGFVYIGLVTPIVVLVYIVISCG